MEFDYLRLEIGRNRFHGQSVEDLRFAHDFNLFLENFKSRLVLMLILHVACHIWPFFIVV